jgi:hypothetical protein
MAKALGDVLLHRVFHSQFQFFEGSFLLKIFQIQVGGLRKLSKLGFVL